MRFRVHGDELFLEPLPPTECQPDECDGLLAYAIVVALPGRPRDRQEYASPLPEGIYRSAPLTRDVLQATAAAAGLDELTSTPSSMPRATGRWSSASASPACVEPAAGP